MPTPLTIGLRTVWHFRNRENRELDLTLVTLLEAIERTGKLTLAAQDTGISHRHAWNLIEQWAGFFGAPLVAVNRGRGTRLSPLGAKLLWAGRRAQARLEPELENIAAELASLLTESAAELPALRIHASHDFCLLKLRDLALRAKVPGIDLRFHGSAESLASLRRGACDLAGFHVMDGPLGRQAALHYARLLQPEAHSLVRVATRLQGLIVRRGNPKAIGRAADLVRPGVRFVNRQSGSGTRFLLDEMLEKAGLEASQVEGYENEEQTHAAVAAQVASGLADAGLGIEAAAVQFQLGFVPIVAECYFLALHREALALPEVDQLIGLVRGAAFQKSVRDCHGEHAHRTGEIAPVRDTPPWDKLL